VGWYLTRLLEALSRVLEEDRVYVWMNNPTPEEKARVSENRYVSVAVSHYPWAALRLTWNTLGTPAMDSLIGRPADVYFYPNSIPLPQKQGGMVLFLHDTHLLTDPQATVGDLKALRAALERPGGGADLVLTPSEFNRTELFKNFKDLPSSKVRVVPHGIPDAFLLPAPAEKVREAREKYRLQRPYFLFVGTLEPRKNLLRLVHAFLLFRQRVKTDHGLILVGPKGSVADDMMQFILAPQVADNVKWLDFVRPEDMPALYTGADAFLYPALKEGFGLPLLEAMGCGTPVICSNTGAIPEVVGDGGWMVDPLAVGEWSSAMERAATEKAFLGVLRERGRARASQFRMDTCAAQTLAALKLAAKIHA